jgi:hypothetical protein
MGDWVNTLLPIFTLLLGAGWGNLLKRGELRNAMRLEAADQLAELPAKLWSKGEPDDWVRMNTAVDRLTMRLGLAGVPTVVAAKLAAAASEFWDDVHELDAGAHGDELAVGTAVKDSWDGIAAAVGELLSSSNPWQRREIVKRVNSLDIKPATPEVTVGGSPSNSA